MSKVLQISSAIPELDYANIPKEIIPFLASYNLIPQLLSQRIIESAIAPITCTQAEISHALDQFYQHWDLTTAEKSKIGAYVMV